MSSLLTLLYGV